ncbi:hypothetical protein JCGZ_24022 [Jatropha curcas]|uniref:Uncharacterized protein n=1 Tax=Jatropha curcas TaxID=180498 RepID=A0A067LHI7_JATCU|nr:hypothetical protein JCGZ_24022 [Jatropha curcas]
MSVSMEALAMAGVDYLEWGKQVQEWKQDDEFESPPPHLLAEEEEEEICRDLRVEMKQSEKLNERMAKRLRDIALMVKTIIRLLMISCFDICQRYFKS